MSLYDPMESDFEDVRIARLWYGAAAIIVVAFLALCVVVLRQIVAELVMASAGVFVLVTVVYTVGCLIDKYLLVVIYRIISRLSAWREYLGGDE